MGGGASLPHAGYGADMLIIRNTVVTIKTSEKYIHLRAKMAC